METSTSGENVTLHFEKVQEITSHGFDRQKLRNAMAEITVNEDQDTTKFENVRPAVYILKEQKI